MQSLSNQLGLLEYPFFFCSVLGCIIILERFLLLVRSTVSQNLNDNAKALVRLYAKESNSARADIASLWLQRQQKKLLSGIKLLNLLVIITPLLGLLGTVLGLIQAFGDISQQVGPVEVSTLAKGLGLAMTTTAAGLIIAIPFMAISHLYQLWVARMLDATELKMNKENLLVDGLDLSQLKI